MWTLIQRKYDYQIIVERKSPKSTSVLRRLTVNKSEELLSYEFCYGISKARKLPEYSKCVSSERGLQK